MVMVAIVMNSFLFFFQDQELERTSQGYDVCFRHLSFFHIVQCIIISICFLYISPIETYLYQQKLPYRLIKTEIKDVKGLTIGHLKLEKPSNLTDIPASQQEGCLYTLSVTDQHSLRILREIYHENILHSEALISSSSTSINLFVEK